MVKNLTRKEMVEKDYKVLRFYISKNNKCKLLKIKKENDFDNTDQILNFIIKKHVN